MVFIKQQAQKNRAGAVYSSELLTKDVPSLAFQGEISFASYIPIDVFEPKDGLPFDGNQARVFRWNVRP